MCMRCGKRTATKSGGCLCHLVVHCKRKKYDVYIGRPSVWGNPYSHEDGTLAQWKVDSREEAIQKFEEFVMKHPGFQKMIREELKGLVLGCWCAPKSCHGDILVRVANEEV